MAEARGPEEPDDLDGWATVLLGIQQISSTTSLYGFLTTGSAILFSGSVGSLTDRYKTNRLQIVRFFILAQKLLVVASYGLFYVFFSSDNLRQGAQNGGRGPDASHSPRADVWSLFGGLTCVGTLLILCNVGVSVSIERDWVTSIAQGSSRRLTRLNAIMRRIDLLSKLLAPLFVSLLTTATGYGNACIILLAISASTSLFELSFIGIVFQRFRVLGREESAHRQERLQRQPAVSPDSAASSYPPQGGLRQQNSSILQLMRTWAREQYDDWRMFVGMPIFLTSISISLLYMSVLSFDSTFIAYLKSETSYSDAFIAGMRGLCVVTGLLGTFLSPYLTEKIGLTRTGSWSIWSEVVPLSLSIVSFYQGADTRHRSEWNTALLFVGLSLSRIGLWSFDLAQLAQVQSAISLHPRRNSLMGLQFALQNLLDLMHYVMTIVFSKPSSFRIPADISYGAIILAAFLYVFGFARRERGHLVHLDRMGLDMLFRRKAL